MYIGGEALYWSLSMHGLIETQVVILPAPCSQYESWLFPGSHYLMSSTPKPIPCHECTDVTILACSTWSLIFQFLHARSLSVIFRPCLSLWLLLARRVGDQVPSQEARPKIKLNSVKHCCLHKHWHSDWWASLPNSVLGRCDLLRTCQYNVCCEQGTVWMAAQRYQCLLPQRYIMHLKGITLLWNTWCYACSGKGFLFYLKDRKLSILFTSVLCLLHMGFFLA